MPKPITFQDGAHSRASFASSHLQPFFDSGVITQYPGASYYAVCYGELCAYARQGALLAVWSAEVPDSEQWVMPAHPDYAGEWRKP